VALRLDEVVPPTLRPFDTVKAEVDAAWRADALAKALSARAVEIKAAVEGGAPLGSFGIVDVTLSTTREGFIEGTPPTLLPAVFQMAQGDVRVIEAEGFIGIVQLDSIQPADTDSPDATAIRSGLAAQIEQAIAQDAFQLFSTALTAEAGITINDAAINAVHAQVQ
jgi:peptidyl-prolyl cis-trans isomerase D